MRSDELQQLLVGYVKAVGTHQVKRNEPVVFVKVVDGKRGVDLRYAALDPSRVDRHRLSRWGRNAV